MTVGVIPTIGPYLMPKILPELRKRYPQFELTLLEEQSHVLLEWVKTGVIDTAILALPYQLEGLMAFEFWEEDFYWIVDRTEAEAYGDEVDSDSLDHSRLMLLKEGHCLKDHALAACRLADNAANKTFQSTSLYTLIQMVASGLGTTLIPDMARRQLLKSNTKLRALRLTEPGPHRRIAFIVRPNYTGVHNIEALMSLFKRRLNQSVL